jgi:hypothetical protein
MAEGMKFKLDVTTPASSKSDIDFEGYKDHGLKVKWDRGERLAYPVIKAAQLLSMDLCPSWMETFTLQEKEIISARRYGNLKDRG